MPESASAAEDKERERCAQWAEQFAKTFQMRSQTNYSKRAVMRALALLADTIRSGETIDG